MMPRTFIKNMVLIHFSTHLNFSFDLNGKHDVKVVVGEERHVEKVGC